MRSALQLKRVAGAGRGSVAGASSWACSREARDGIKFQARSILGHSCQTLASMRCPGLSSSVVQIMNGAMRASGADAGAENGCPAANKALLLTRKTNDGVAGCGARRCVRPRRSRTPRSRTPAVRWTQSAWRVNR